MNKAVIYARYSSDKQREESIEGQLMICHDFAKKNNLQVIKEYIDRAKTGTRTNRSEFQRMIMDSNTQSFQYVILYKTDRFARNEHDSIVNEHYLMTNGVQLMYATQPFLNNRGGRIIKAIYRVQDEEYSINLSERTKLGLAMNIEKGNAISGQCPIGYKIENKKMVIDDEKADIPRLIFSLYAAGIKATDINKKLVEKGYNSFNINSISRMIRNKKYIGTLTFQGKEHLNYHPQLIDNETFEIANSMLNNKRARHGGRSIEKYLLSGYLFDQNGKRFVGNSGNGEHGKKYRYYSLGKLYLKKEKIEKAVIESILSTLSISSAEYAQEIHNQLLNSSGESNADIARKKLNSINKEINNLVNAIKTGIINDSVKDELDRLEKLRIHLQSELMKPDVSQFSVLQLRRMVEQMKKRHLTESDKASLISSMVDKIVVFKDYVVIYYQLTGQSISFDDIRSSDEKLNGAFKHIYPKVDIIIDTNRYIYLTSTFRL